jgi:hypothetical protein
VSVGEAALNVAVGLTRAWTHAYTAGLPPVARSRRRTEIDADIWDQVRDSRSYGRPAGATALHLFARFILGVADDVAWRIDEVPPHRVRGILRWTTAVTLAVAAIAVWLNALTRVELPVPTPIMSFTAAPPSPPPPPPPPPPPIPRDFR